jgi:hypothetical protein
MFGNIVIKPTVVEFKTKKGAKKSSKSRELTILAGEALPAKPVRPAPKVEAPPKRHHDEEEEEVELGAEDFQSVEDIDADEKLR